MHVHEKTLFTRRHAGRSQAQGRGPGENAGALWDNFLTAVFRARGALSLATWHVAAGFQPAAGATLPQAEACGYK
jgi:hypothetical protein